MALSMTGVALAHWRRKALQSPDLFPASTSRREARIFPDIECVGNPNVVLIILSVTWVHQQRHQPSTVQPEGLFLQRDGTAARLDVQPVTCIYIIPVRLPALGQPCG